MDDEAFPAVGTNVSWETGEPAPRPLRMIGTKTMDDLFKNPEPLLATLSSLFAAQNRRKEVAILAASKIMISHEYDGWDGGTYYVSVFITVPGEVYSGLGNERESLEIEMREKCAEIVSPYAHCHIRGLKIAPGLVLDDEWRKKAYNWLIGNKDEKIMLPG
jgi:hypothetical protein